MATFDRRIVQPSTLRFLQACHVRTPFHLAGGAALAGVHLRHRLSRDADLFFHDRHTHREAVALLPEAAAEARATIRVVRDAGTFVRSAAVTVRPSAWEVVLTPRAFEVLLILVEQPGHLVTRDTWMPAEEPFSRVMPSLSLLDLRIEKIVPLPGQGRTPGLYLDAMNVLNADGALSYRNQSGPFFGLPNVWLDPRTMRLGLKTRSSAGRKVGPALRAGRNRKAGEQESGASVQ